MLHADVTDKILRSFCRVYNQLGYGFLEEVYENALAIACREIGMHVEQQTRIEDSFDGCPEGVSIADLLVEKRGEKISIRENPFNPRASAFPLDPSLPVPS